MGGVRTALLFEMGGFAEELLYQKYPSVPMGAPINILIVSTDVPWVK